MGSQSLKEWSRYEVMAKQVPLHFSGHSPLDCHYDFSTRERVFDFDDVPLMGSLPTDPLYSLLDLIPSPSAIQEDFLFGYGSGFGVWNHEIVATWFEPQNQPLQLCDIDWKTVEECVEEKKKVKWCRSEEKRSKSSKTLSRKIISQHFCMPITQAAKELNVRMSLLKKKCRKLGIRRWPHKKLMSLQTLIKNVQELGKDEGEWAERRLREAIEILEQERKLMEEVPDLELEDKTKRLRQAFFKASYKKRKLMGMMMMMESHSSSSGNLASTDATADYETSMDDEEEEEMKSLLSDCFSSSDVMF